MVLALAIEDFLDFNGDVLAVFVVWHEIYVFCGIHAYAKFGCVGDLFLVKYSTFHNLWCCTINPQ